MKIENRDRELPTERRGQEEKKAEGTTLRALLCSSATLKMGYGENRTKPPLTLMGEMSGQKERKEVKSTVHFNY